MRAVAATYLLLPQVPMLFMGEEWAAAQPFPFFCDFGAELAASVREGRREEFARFPEFQDPAMRDRIPDPTAEATFESAKLRWDALRATPHAETLAWYRSILAMRRASIGPLLRNIRAGGQYEVVGEGAVTVLWSLSDRRGTLLLAANLSDSSVSGFPASAGEVLWQEGPAGSDGRFGPWAVRWSIERSSGGSALDELAERMGIEFAFLDARGNVVNASVEAKLRLLEAMGVDASDEETARSALAELDYAGWRTALPPVLVMYERGGTDLTLPGAISEVAWHIALEQGGERRGTLDFMNLPLRMECHHEGETRQRRWWVLPDGLPWGYHRLSIDPDGGSSVLIVTPGQCWLPEAITEGRRLWGMAAQLYLLRSAIDWGIGDFGDLQTLVELAASRGADVIGVNPLHALFPDNPEYASPYSPASRLLLNILNISVPWAAARLNCTGLIASDEIQQRVNSCRSQSLVDYTGVAALKLDILGQLFEAFDRTAENDIGQDFDYFRRERGEVLERHCLFLALREHFSGQLSTETDWRRWPDAFRDPSAPAVAEFAAKNRRRVDFFVWTQWIADEQLGAAATAAHRRGMPVGLYRDLAVGADRAGGETWANRTVVVSSAQVGAPPDIHNPAGQNWGLPPFHPRALREEAYQSFIELVRANMRHAGGLRIDHVMALQQLYWVPQGQKPDAGAYVRYKLSDLVGILALENHRHRCLVVGEDLGTVPEGFRDAMTAANIFSYRVLYFEQDVSGNFLPPTDYPPLAVAVVGNHDLPPLRGWWENRDIALKQRLGLYPAAGEEERQREMRQHDKEALLTALRGAALLPADETEPEVPILSRAAHAYLARAASAIVMVQIDDLTDEAEPVNVPATSDEHPNWRRRMSMTLEELSNRPRFIDIAEIFRAERE